MQHTALRLMSERGIQVLFGCEALSINYNPDGYHQIVCSDGKKIDFFEAIWCTQVLHFSVQERSFTLEFIS